MSFHALLALYLSLLFLIPVGEARAQRKDETPTFQTSVQMVLVPVTVTDRNGKTIEGLNAVDFNVLDNQQPQKIVSFSTDDAPCSIGLVLDVSGSMQQTLSETKEITHVFFGTANLDDEFLLLTVSTQPAAATRFTTDTAALEESIELAKPGGLTALIDTVYLGLRRMGKGSWPRRALLILSDGMDNHSRYSQNELMRMALEADVQIYTIIIDSGSAGTSTQRAPYRPSLVTKPWDRAEERQGAEMLEKLSDETGGLHFRVRTSAEAQEAVTKIGRALRDEYVIGYRLPDPEPFERWHRIRVRLNASRAARVQARKGYYSH
jgi:Ca-activated chloride channel homolog